MRAALIKIAYAEAAALLGADMDDVDLACESYLSEADAWRVREWIRDVLAVRLQKRSDRIAAPSKRAKGGGQ